MEIVNVKEFYKSGFPKEVTRGKYDLKINARLKAARNRRKLSSAGVVRELKKYGVKIGHSTLQGYEADENSLNHRYPSLPVLIGLANFYGCSIDYLIGQTDKFKSTSLNKDVDLMDYLQEGSVNFNGKRLTKTEREQILATIELLTSNSK